MNSTECPFKAETLDEIAEELRLMKTTFQKVAENSLKTAIANKLNETLIARAKALVEWAPKQDIIYKLSVD